MKSLHLSFEGLVPLVLGNSWSLEKFNVRRNLKRYCGHSANLGTVVIYNN